jgi:hypothetical protein
MANNYYKPKVWNAYCDSCGFKFKSDQLKLRWDNFMVCKHCWEPRQPQDLLRAVRETSNNLPWARPDTDGIDVGPSYVTLYIADGYYEEGPAPNQTYYEEL